MVDSNTAIGLPQSPSSSHCSSASSEGPDIVPFLPLIDAIDLDQLCLIASEIRSRYQRDSTEGSAKIIKCKVDQAPVVGSFNLIYYVDFVDGLRWVARFPGCSLNGFGRLERTQMQSDCRTMQLIHRKSKLLMPELFAFETENALVSAPFMLMSFIEGKTVSKRWFDKTWVTEERRCSILQQLATLVGQLHSLRFEKIGSLVFDEDGAFSHIGPKHDRKFEQPLDLDNVKFDWGRLVELGPYDNTRSYLLDDWDELKDNAEWTHAQLALIRLAVDSIPTALIEHGDFVLSHPDLDSQNVLVDEEGNITGLIDWDGVLTQPAIGGFAKYPSWITRDWDPCMYAYGKGESDDGLSDDSCAEEDSPEDLARYRTVYLSAFQGLKLTTSSWEPDLTKKSHLFEAIEIAVGNRICRAGIVPKLLDFAFRSAVPFEFPDFCDAYLERRADTWLAQVKAAFEAMWHY